jgi:hypothetical protein
MNVEPPTNERDAFRPYGPSRVEGKADGVARPSLAGMAIAGLCAGLGIVVLGRLADQFYEHDVAWWVQLLAYVAGLQLIWLAVGLVSALTDRRPGPRAPMWWRPAVARSVYLFAYSLVLVLVAWGAERRWPGTWWLAIPVDFALAFVATRNSFALFRLMQGTAPADDRLRSMAAVASERAGIAPLRAVVAPPAWEAPSGAVGRLPRRGSAVAVFGSDAGDLDDDIVAMGALRVAAAERTGVFRRAEWRDGLAICGINALALLAVGSFAPLTDDVRAQRRYELTDDLEFVAVDVDDGTPRRERPEAALDFCFFGLLGGTAWIAAGARRRRRDQTAVDRAVLDLTGDADGLRSYLCLVTVRGPDAATVEERLALIDDWEAAQQAR